MGLFNWFFPRRIIQATPPARYVPLSRKAERLLPQPTPCDQWKRVSSAEWLKPDMIHQEGSRIAANPQYYDWCGELVKTLFKQHPNVVTQPVERTRPETDTWTCWFGAAVARWVLLLPLGIPDQRHYCNGLAVCLTLPGFNTDEEIEDFLTKAESGGAACRADGDLPFLSISDLALLDRGYDVKRSGLWISAIPVLRATLDRTFPRGEPLEQASDFDGRPKLIHNLRAFNPTLLPPTPSGLWNDGHISWLGNSSFLSFLDAWVAATPISAADVPYGEPGSATGYESLAASGFAELCKACGATYFDPGDALCARCGCRADNRDGIEQYASSTAHARWVLGELKDEVARELQRIEEDRSRAEEAHRRQKEERLEQQRKLAAQQREAEHKKQEKLRVDREKQDALVGMASATESIVSLRRQLDESQANEGTSSDQMREACLRRLSEAIGQYETASRRYEQLQQEGKAQVAE